MDKNRFKYLFRPRILMVIAIDFLGAIFSYLLSLLITFLLTGNHKARISELIFNLRFDSIVLSAVAATFIFSVICILFLTVFGTYRNIVSFSLESSLLRSVAASVLGSGIAVVLNGFILLENITNNHTILLLLSICTALITTIAFSLIRVCYSYVNNRIKMSVKKENGKRCAIIGAGFTGQTILKEIYHSTAEEYNPVCFIDDDETKISRNISSIPIYGPIVLLPEICKKHHIESVIFAIPSCDEGQRARILSLCSRTQCEIIEVPSLFKLSNKIKFMPQSRSVNVNELLNRDVIHVDESNYRKFIVGKTVLVTGVGSIGSELCRQIVTFSPKKLVMVDIYENNAYDIQQELINKGYRDIIDVEIASVRDNKKLEKIFETYNPDLVFHAAAHKHVPLMEHNPEESIKNNVMGTLNVAKLCKKYKVQKMVLISTDKAVNPTNVMGATKRCCEMIMQYMAQQKTCTEFVAVRFGNVLGSNGSVIPLFCRQIEAGGPVTVTHPDIIRYFMTIPEAVSLVLQAGAIANGGEIFVLNMGDPVKITTLAENLIRMYGYEPYTQMPIKFTGLRPGEKLFEELLMSEENLKPTQNKKIFIGNQIEIDPKVLEENLAEIAKISQANDSKSVVEYLHKMVPTFKYPSEVNKK